MIMNGNRPRLISGVPNSAVSAATTRSQARAMPSAPASTCPFAAQIVGLPSPPITPNRRTKRSVAKWRWMSGVSAANCATLPPEENTLSCVEVRTTQRTLSSLPACSKASVSSPSRSFESALRVSGSSSAIVAMPPSPAP